MVTLIAEPSRRPSCLWTSPFPKLVSPTTNPLSKSCTAPETISSLKVALPAALPSMVRNVVSEPPSVPFRIISELFAAASIVMSPELVVMLTAASPAEISSAADEPEPI